MSPVRGIAAGTAYLRRAGTTPLPLVLLHGVGSDAESWRPLMAALDPAIDVIAWDAPGYGASEPLTRASPSPSDYADRLAAWLDALDLPRVHLVGHSLGCLFAARFTVTRPERVETLTLLSPALGYGVAAGAPLPPGVQARIDDLEALGAAGFAAKRAARLVFRPEDHPDVLAGVRRGMAAVHRGGYAQAVRALGAGRLVEDAAAITVPTRVAIGVEDVVTPPANAHEVQAVLRRPLGLTLVPDAGHALPQQAPAAVARLLMEGPHV